MSKVANGFLNAIPKGLPKLAEPTVPTLEKNRSVYEKLDEVLEKENLKLPKSWKTKDVADWNKKDLLLYFYARYRETYHAKLSNNIPWQADYASMEDIAVMIEKQIHGHASIAVVKDYFDYCFDSNYINDLLSKKTRFTLNDLKKEKPVIQFAQSLTRGYQPQPTVDAPKVAIPKPVEAAEPVKVGITVEDLNSAYSIHSQYFVELYGLLIPVNYLMVFKKKSEEEAVAYVRKAFEKIASAKNGEKKKAKLVEITNNFGPYPSWLPFTNIKAFMDAEIKISENESFRSFKK